MTINYKIELLSDWHCGAGFNAGAGADDTVIKDENGLPYIPGKTIKGLLRNSLLEINEVQGNKYQSAINIIFGKMIEGRNSESGHAFFSNAEIHKDQQKEIISNQLTPMLYRNITSTAIEKNGLAKKGSLRVKEVCMPLTLEGEIAGLDVTHEDILIKAFQWTRHLGANRNRGLGRCHFSKI